MLKAALLLICAGLISLLAWPFIQDPAITVVLAMLLFVVMAPLVLGDPGGDLPAHPHAGRSR